jgi:hypothetical protein
MSKDNKPGSLILPWTGTYENPAFDPPVFRECGVETSDWSFDDYKAMLLDFGKAYAEAFGAVYEEITDHPAIFTFDEVDSPKEYNFTTDRIFATMPARDILRMYKETNLHTMDQVCIDRHTSREGFMSFYSPRWRYEWPQYPELWDHNQLASLLWARLLTEEPELREYELECRVMEEGNIHEVIDNHIVINESDDELED